MSEGPYISESVAMRLLMHDGGYSEAQSRIILSHSLRQSHGDDGYYPLRYIHSRVAGKR